MNKRIFKFKINEVDTQVIETHFGAKPLSVQYQHDDLTVWMAVDTDEPKTGRIEIVIVGTGNPANHAAGMTFLGTVQEPKRPFVWHVFYR